MSELPSGTVTFLFSDVEGSTQLLERHGAAMGSALARHHELFEQMVDRHGGAIFETVGDAVYAAFGDAGEALAAAIDVQRALADEDWGPIGRLAVRIAVHTGAVERRGDHYFGPALFRVARLQALGYGEQTLVSAVTAGLAADALPTGVSLRDLGTHRLKDLGEPEHVFQLDHPELRTEFPALKSLDAHPHNLPVQLSSFVGREAEVTELGHLLGRERAITLLGPGGIGKTRLALQVAVEQLEAFPDGVFFVDLAPVRDPELVPGAIATSLGLREQPDQPIRVTLVEHLATRRTLLVLDNLEQLLPAAVASVAELLGATHEVRVLVTSRAPLRIRGEHEYGVAPLATGASDRLEDEVPPAVALFLERARAIKPDLDITPATGPLISLICERLDGLPLAIELAAARLRLFSLAQLHQRVTDRLPLLTGGARDLPERQQTLRAAIAWSVDLLSDAERRLFTRLGVFVGGCTFDAADAVAGSDLGANILDAMTALIEHSLVWLSDPDLGEPRYTMLETIREYALEQLQASVEGSVTRARHARHFSAVISDLVPRLETMEQRDALIRLRSELGNLRYSLEYYLKTDPTEYLRMAHQLVVPWLYFDGRLSEYEALLLSARPAALAASTSEMARWNLDLGHLRFAQGDVRGASAALVDVLNSAASEQLGRDGIVALRLMAAVAREREDFDEAQRLVEEALKGARSSGEALEEGHARLTSALIATRMASYDAAGEEFRSAIAIFERHGDYSNIASARLANGYALEYKRDVSAAQDEYQAALALFETLGDELGATECRMALGYLSFLRGEPRKAIASILEAADAMHSAGKRLELTQSLATLAVVIDSMGFSGFAAILVGWCEAEIEQLGLGWKAETHAESNVGDARFLHLQRDPAWEQERQQGRHATVPELLGVARAVAQSASSRTEARPA